ncbi:ribonuclease P protein component [Salisediminibacterium halotolerans]|uniref:Ribonuclease P protein component n=1 Tax=Salisediminibacterium halotolerans TaxID=517425 RepID=A0A1H9WMR6_9BACI|nr:ribonuclease P protein component [Salisediminibacterium haloalkalitolerans]SES35212.1 ribonuclease P protein component [Salisediminibacterium haloalkalitolerans]
MNKSYRLKKNQEFQRVFKHGKSVANRQFVVYFLEKPEQLHPRFGLSVSKKMGHAVTRNLIKRRMKEALSQLAPNIKKETDVVIIARKPVSTMDFHEIKKSLTHVLNVARLFNKRPPKRK